MFRIPLVVLTAFAFAFSTSTAVAAESQGNSPVAVAAEAEPPAEPTLACEENPAECETAETPPNEEQEKEEKEAEERELAGPPSTTPVISLTSSKVVVTGNKATVRLRCQKANCTGTLRLKLGRVIVAQASFSLKRAARKAVALNLT